MLATTSTYAFTLEPGAGFGLEYTDNATLSANNEVSDVITSAYIGAKIEEDTGVLSGSATTSLQKQRYTKNAFADSEYFNLAANANLVMLKNRLDWQVQDNFNQRLVVADNAETPDNLQDTNIFTFGPNITIPVTDRQTFSIQPQYQKYYYEVQETDNKQFSISASWNYRLYRAMNLGLQYATRDIEYDQMGVPDNTIDQTHLVLSGRRVMSEYSLSLGKTKVEREGFSSLDGTTGNLTLKGDLTSRSKITLGFTSELTDSSSSQLHYVLDPELGPLTEVQITTDIIRNRVTTLSYNRQDASLRTRLWAEQRKTDYSESPNDREVKAIGAEFNYPLTSLLSIGAHARYNSTSLLGTNRIDKQTVYGGKASYRLSRKLRCLFDLQLVNKDSTLDTEDYDELRVFASIAYGFGNAQRKGGAAVSKSTGNEE